MGSSQEVAPRPAAGTGTGAGAGAGVDGGHGGSRKGHLMNVVVISEPRPFEKPGMGAVLSVKETTPS